MNIINFETLLVTIFVLVDDWCQTQKTLIKPQSPVVQPCFQSTPVA